MGLAEETRSRQWVEKPRPNDGDDPLAQVGLFERLQCLGLRQFLLASGLKRVLCVP